MIILVAIVTAIILVLTLQEKSHSRRLAALDCALIIGLIIALSTEILSLFGLFQFSGVLGVWIFVSIISAAIIIRKLHKKVLTPAWPSVRLPKDIWPLFAGVSLIVIVLGVIALLTAPSSADSFSYHLPRTSHWIQNKSIAHYPTHIFRQLYISPGAEYVISHLRILSGNDWLVNLVQFFCMVGTLIAISLIAKQLGATVRGQMIAVVFAVTLPMGIRQSITTLNDYVVGFWLCVFILHTFRLLKPLGSENKIKRLVIKEAGLEQKLLSKIHLRVAVFLGISLGLAILCKATSFLFALPFVPLVIIAFWKRIRWRSWVPLGLIAAIVIGLNFGLYYRNHIWFGSALGPDQALLRNQEINPAIVVSGLLRNFAIHLETPVKSWNRALQESIETIHDFLGISTNDPRTTWPNTSFTIHKMQFKQARPGNSFHLLLLLVIAIGAVVARRKNLIPALLLLTCVVIGGILFSGILKWQPWHSRLHLPLFLLAAPTVGVICEEIFAKRLCILLALALLTFSIGWIFYLNTRPLLGPQSVLTMPRLSQYFQSRPYVENIYRAAVSKIVSKGWTKIGIISYHSGWEYPVWVLLESELSDFQIEHVNVVRYPVSLELQKRIAQGFQPDGVLVIKNPKDNKERIKRLTVNSQRYRLFWGEGELLLYKKVTPKKR